MNRRKKPPPLGPEKPRTFRTTVHGTIFAGRDRHLDQMETDDELILIPDPPTEPEPGVWVHLPDGDPLGYLPREIGRWLAPWILRGGRTSTRVIRVEGPEVPSWRRLLIEVRCLTGVS